MNVVDTSGWLEYFSGGPNAPQFADPIRQTEQLIVPVITVYELSKVILRERDEDHLMQALAAIQKGSIKPLTATLSVAAAKISLRYKLPMADSIIYATATQHRATVWTQDVDFKALPDVRYIEKRPGS
jgi:predicted nucleic acid-binding protein